MQQIKQALMQVYSEKGSSVPENIIDKMVLACEKIKADFLLSQKHGQFAMRLTPRKLTDFDEICKTAHLNNGYYDHYENDTATKEKLFAKPANIEPEELVLYYEGEEQSIPEKGFHQYFLSKGYEVIQNPAPSLLIDACAILTEEKLTELGIPTNVDIILPSSYENTFTSAGGVSCFSCVHRNGGRRNLNVTLVEGDWARYFVFLLRKVA